ncbi:MAG: DUF3332 domain-containing protein [Muribaculaceae bacterium]|nr:DUF3332 domain-containing protein [Muribaculaceae bacterium]
MRKKYFTVAVVLSLAATLTLSSCLGSFALTNKVLTWNRQVGDKFVNEIVFFALWVLPVYELSMLADITVINSIEFWSGENPVIAQTKVIDGKDARYLVKSDKGGYTITNLDDKTTVQFNFDAKDNSWSIESNGEEHKLFTYVDDTHIKVANKDGGFDDVELSDQGVWAYEQNAIAQSEQYASR